MWETSTSGSQWVKIRLNASRIWCSPTNSPRTVIIYYIHQWHSGWGQIGNQTICRQLCLLQANHERPRLWTTPKGYQSSNIMSWAKKWFMCFELSKCKIMHITQKTTHKISDLSIHYGTNESGLCPAHEISLSNDIRWPLMEPPCSRYNRLCQQTTQSP